MTAILHGTRGITADIALRLGRYFDISAAFWMNLQQIYDLRRAEQEIGDGLSRIPTRRGGRGPSGGMASGKGYGWRKMTESSVGMARNEG